ncbi:1-(5-phosphoribosyl)-5-[(5-phosphoribosylamino)methylideneamino]imidazole-4-carboxamide isomerase [Caldicellulosiruptoraceae bacterium PP1]
MKILPAIDLMNKKCVRLKKGDFSQSKIFNEDPIQQAKIFEQSGSKYIHIVDLDGAKEGKPVNIEIIKQIKKFTNLYVECGGGIRSLETASEYLNNGINNIIIGSLLFKNKKLVIDIINNFGMEKVTAGIDFLDNQVKISGWLEDSKIELDYAIQYINEIGLKRLIVTDINKDGMLQGPNIEVFKKLRKLFNGELIASGGISTINDLKILKEIEVDGVIIGMALYENKIDLKEALKI